MDENHKGYAYWLSNLEYDLKQTTPLADTQDTVLRLVQGMAETDPYQGKTVEERLELLAAAVRHLVFTKTGSIAEHEALQQLGWIMATVVDTKLSPNEIAAELLQYKPLLPGLVSRMRLAWEVITLGRFRFSLRA